MLRVYISARWARQAEMREVRDGFNKIPGIGVRASWLDEVEGTHPEAEAAKIDLNEVKTSDVLVAFTETPDIGYYTGGRHVELGAALAMGIPVICVGPRENIFCHLVIVTQVETLKQAELALFRFIDLLK